VEVGPDDHEPFSVTLAWTPVKVGHMAYRLPLVYVGRSIEWGAYEYMTTLRVWTLNASSLLHLGRAVRDLFRYYNARGRPVLSQADAIDLYDDFASALVKGTIENGYDPLGLYWSGIKYKNAKLLIAAVREFSEHLRDNYGGPCFSPLVSPACSELGCAYRRHLEIRKANSVFAHSKNLRSLYATARIPQHNAFGRRGRGGGSGKHPPPPFPEAYVNDFFRVGMRRRKLCDLTGNQIADNYNVRDFLYFLLLMFGGLRSVEPLHLYLEDIQPDSSHGAAVFLWHPEDGAPPPQSLAGFEPRHRPATREAYLTGRYGLFPRNSPEMRGLPEAAGWKNLLLEESVPQLGVRSRVYWQNAAVGRLFWRLHSIYVMHVRPSTEKHPYYFVSLDRGSHGEPWKEASAKEAFGAALRRIGLEPNSSIGLCRHAMRHRLGYYLVKRGVDPQVIQIFLHQQSIASQEIYKKLTPQDVNEVLTRASEKRERGVADFDAENLGISWKSDPLKVFEGPSDRLLKKFIGLASGARSKG